MIIIITIIASLFLFFIIRFFDQIESEKTTKKLYCFGGYDW